MSTTKHTPEKIPIEIVVNEEKASLELSFFTGSYKSLSFEFLRVHSPSAEVRGHGKGQETLQVGKKNVKIVILDPVGNYGMKPKFSDGHDTGIYSWSYLNYLLDNKDLLWNEYLKKIECSNASRE